jgi:hypothetical protein
VSFVGDAEVDDDGLLVVELHDTSTDKAAPSDTAKARVLFTRRDLNRQFNILREITMRHGKCSLYRAHQLVPAKRGHCSFASRAASSSSCNPAAAPEAPTSTSDTSTPAVQVGCEPSCDTKYCDDPIREDGTWNRCWNYPPTPFYDKGQRVWLYDGGIKCFTVHPSKPWPALPPGQPQHHIEP